MTWAPVSWTARSCSWYASRIAGSGCGPGGSWSVPAPLAISVPSRAARPADRRISSRAAGQGSPIPRCAVSIASATANPCAHKYSRNPSVASQSMLPSGKAATCAAAKTLREAGGGYPAAQGGSGMATGWARPGRLTRMPMSPGQPGHVDPASLGRGLQGEPGQLHPPGALGEVPGEGRACRHMLEEQLPLHLEAVVEQLMVWYIGPLRLVVDGVGQVRVPHRHGRAGPGLHHAVPQAGHRAAAGPVDLQLDQLAAVHPDGPGGVDRRHRPVPELPQRVGRVVGGHWVRLA